MAKKIGIDVSAFQKNIDWKKVKAAGVEFAIIKASQGKDKKYPDGFIDGSFESHYAGAKAAGVPIGAYHFAVFTSEAQAKWEAQYFLDALKGKTFELPLCLDLEDLPAGRSPIISQVSTKAQLTDYSIIFLEELKAAGYRVMLYTNLDWERNKLDYARLEKYWLWHAQYPYGYNPVDMDYLYEHRPSAVPEHTSIWQCTPMGRIDGIDGNVDMNWCFNDLIGTEGDKDEKPTIESRIAELEKKLLQYTYNSRVKYQWVDTQMPAWAKPTIHRLTQAGILKGDGDGNLQLSVDMMRLLVVMERYFVNDGLIELQEYIEADITLPEQDISNSKDS